MFQTIRSLFKSKPEPPPPPLPRRLAPAARPADDTTPDTPPPAPAAAEAAPPADAALPDAAPRAHDAAAHDAAAHDAAAHDAAAHDAAAHDAAAHDAALAESPAAAAADREPAPAAPPLGDGTSAPRPDFATLLAAAQAADAEADAALAWERWTELRDHYPSEPAGYRGQAGSLLQFGLVTEAEAVLLEAHARFPENPDFLPQMAQVAEHKGDWPQAAALWRQVVSVHDAHWAHGALARALTQSGAPAEAETVLDLAAARWPDEPDLVIEQARLSGVLGRQTEADALWQAARARFGPMPALMRAHAAALLGRGDAAAARATLEEGLAHAPGQVDLLHDLGQIAAGRGDWPAAEAQWRAVLAQVPDAGWAHERLVQALREQGRTQDADAALAAGCAASADYAPLWKDWARQADAARDWPAAHQRWATLRDIAPDDVDGWFHAANALREAGRHEEARAAYESGTVHFPDHAVFYEHLARLAEQRQDFAAMERLWRRYLALEPRGWWGLLSLANACRAQGRTAEGEALLLQAAEAFPGMPIFLDVHANWARERGDWAEAERRAIRLAETLPDAWEGLWGQGIAARELGRLDEAETLLRSGAARFPDIPRFQQDLARVAELRRLHATASRAAP